jgi:hypothetical protein
LSQSTSLNIIFNYYKGPNNTIEYGLYFQEYNLKVPKQVICNNV